MFDFGGKRIKLKTIAIEVFAFFALACPAVLCAPAHSAGPDGEIKALSAGDAAPAVTLIGVGNGDETSVRFSGAGSAAPALVWFWFMSCDDCVRDMKFMREIAAAYRNSISLLAVNVDKPADRVAVVNFIKTSGISGYDNYFDRITSTPFKVTYEASDAFGVSRTPALFVIGHDGKVVFAAEGDIDFDEVEKNIEKVAAKSRN